MANLFSVYEVTDFFPTLIRITNVPIEQDNLYFGAIAH
jgi:hypothetical protein